MLAAQQEQFLRLIYCLAKKSSCGQFQARRSKQGAYLALPSVYYCTAVHGAICTPDAHN